jgi:hypothetical protein
VNEKKLENITRSFETIHNGRYDLLVTTDPMLTEKAKKLAEVVKNGLPDNWAIYRPYKAWQSDKLKADNVEHPQFISKRKSFLNYLKYLRAEKEEGRRYMSIFNEFSVASIVAQILKSPEATALAKKYHFHALHLISPLVGIIDREQKQKYLIYDCFPGGDKALLETLKLVSEHDEVSFKDELKVLFIKNGIDPSDLTSRHFFAAKNENGEIDLYLFDIEFFAEFTANNQKPLMDI